MKTMKPIVKSIISCQCYIMLVFLCGCTAPLSVAAGESYLPLNKGNKWTLETSADSYRNKPVLLEVLESNGYKHTVRFTNPWGKVDWNLTTGADKFYLESITWNGTNVPMPPDTLYFDMTAPEGATWENAIGKVSVSKRNITMTTPSGVYKNAIKFKEISSEGNEMYWTFAPGVGFVQFGEGPYAFKLSKYKELGPPRSIKNSTQSKTHKQSTNQIAESPKIQSKDFANKNTLRVTVPQGNRILGMDINEASDNDYAKATSIAKGIGASFVQIALAWEAIEPNKGDYDSHILDIINVFYPSRGFSVGLSIGTIDTGKIRIPSDLKGKKFNDPEMISRFNSMMDFVISRLPQVDVHVISVGNEINVYLKNDSRKWSQYTEFQREVRKNIKNKLPETFVGSKIMLEGAVDKSVFVKELLKYSDALMVTYYPLERDFTFKAPSSVHHDLGELVSIYPTVPIFILEAGYSSGSKISSEAKQKQFIEELFLAWDRHLDHIPLINLNWLHDHSDSSIDNFKNYYSTSNSNFVEYLATLGLRTRNGVDKPAFIQLKRETTKREWK